MSVEMEEAVRDTLSYAFFCTDDYVADALREVAKADDWRAALDLMRECHEASEDYSCSSWDQCAIEAIRRGVPGDGHFLTAPTAPIMAEIHRLAAKAGGWWMNDESAGSLRLAFVPFVQCGCGDMYSPGSEGATAEDCVNCLAGSGK